MLALIVSLMGPARLRAGTFKKSGNSMTGMRCKAPRRLSAALLFGFFLLPWLGAKGDSQEPPGKRLEGKPIAADGGRIGGMLRQWYSRNTAAGNWGDYYDNRDGGHSRLNLTPYPQMRRVEYTKEQIEARAHWGAQTKVLPHVVIGNSSTSAAPERGGSNIMQYYTNPRGLAFLFTQYVRNNLYVYPEHRDHDPGRNGIGGYGDLFPTNTPYLIASQGSSGSDQAFLRALPYVLAAFRPEVKSRLVQTGSLMPVVQMILRITGKHLAGPEEYLTGKAHPTVFRGTDVDAQKMVEMAHEITLPNLPPIAIIRVLKEDKPTNGIDYFDPERTEKLADTPAVVARIFRGAPYVRKISISADGSRDFNNRSLKFHWKVLRGDPARIKIEYKNPSRSIAEVTVPYFRRSPIAEGSPLESNRIDIGVFVHNGVYYSPPAFITFYTLDNEARTYGAGGRPVEIAYGAGTSAVSVADWAAFFRSLNPKEESWASRFLQRRFQPAELQALRGLADEFHKVHAQRLQAEKQRGKAAAALKTADAVVQKLKAEREAADKSYRAGRAGKPEAGLAEIAQTLETAMANRDKAQAELRTARKVFEDAAAAEGGLLKRQIPPRNFETAALVQKVLNSLLRDPDLWSANAKSFKTLYEAASAGARESFNGVLKTLFLRGVAETADGTLFRWTPAGGERSLSEKLFTRYESMMIERFNAALLSRILFPGMVKGEWRENYVDPRLASQKRWRDIYRYHSDGTPAGWRRYDADGIREFNAEGLLVVEKDARGRCIRARVVKYRLEPEGGNPEGRRAGASPKEVKIVPTDTFRYYDYNGPNDWEGRIKTR